VRSINPRASRLRSVRLAVILGVTLALIAAPAVHGARPDRTVFYPTAPTVFPAGLGCAFDVEVQPVGARVAVTDFSDGREVRIVNADQIVTNLDTNASIGTMARFQETDTYDPATNAISSVAVGRFNIDLFPGDQGPYGEVAEPGLFVSFIGWSEITIDADTGVVTAFSMQGQVTGDLCALLSE
jgi:hypothetical protein